MDIQVISNIGMKTYTAKKLANSSSMGKGGAMSKYSHRIGQNEWSGGEEIIPLTVEEAQEWAERYLDADEYQQLFGEVKE